MLTAEEIRNYIRNGKIIEINRFQGNFRWLSNFYYHTFDYTVEHFYQAAKAVNDPILYKKILKAKSPQEAKRLGRTATLPVDWNSKKVNIMRDCLIDKFSCFPMELLLLSTYNVPLIEGNNWHDNFWGNCYCNKCQHIEGTNVLGKLLMQIRKHKKAIKE